MMDIAPRVWSYPVKRRTLVTLKKLLAWLVASGGSDLHLKTRSPPTFRINGVLRAVDMPPLKPPEIINWCMTVLNAYLFESRDQVREITYE